MLKITESDPSLANKAADFFTCCEALFTLDDSKRILKNPTMPPDLKLALLTYASDKSTESASERKIFQSFPPY